MRWIRRWEMLSCVLVLLSLGPVAASAPIHDAVRNGNREGIEQALKTGFPEHQLNSIDEAGFTPLDLAVKRRDKAIVEFLLGKGAWVDGGLLSQQTPLHVAAAEGFVDMAELLLAKGAKVNAVSGHVTPLYAAAKNRRHEMATFLLRKGADPNIEYYAEPRPLNAAAATGDKKMVEILLAGGAKADPKARSGDYVPPLFDAIRSGNKEVVLLLISKGADVNRTTNFAGNPLRCAASNGQEEIVDILLAKGAPVSQAALFAAKSPRVLDLLLSKGSGDINQQQNGCTLLHMAAAANDANLAEQLVRVLLVRGADPHITGALGRKPRAFAEAAKHARVAQLLADAEQGRRPSATALPAPGTKARSSSGGFSVVLAVVVAVVVLAGFVMGTYFLLRVVRKPKR